jgi:hypothetical protein
MTFTCDYFCEKHGFTTEHSVSGVKFLKHKVQFCIICLDCLEELADDEEMDVLLFEMTYAEWFNFIPNEYKASQN